MILTNMLISILSQKLANQYKKVNWEKYFHQVWDKLYILTRYRILKL